MKICHIAYWLFYEKKNKSVYISDSAIGSHLNKWKIEIFAVNNNISKLCYLSSSPWLHNFILIGNFNNI